MEKFNHPENLNEREISEAETIRKKIGDLIKKNPAAAIDKFAEFARELRERYSIEELHNYEAYCALAGSTPLKKPEKFDLDRENSIEKFLDNLEIPEK